MAQTASPFVLNKVSLTLVKSDAAPGTPIEFKCQLSRAELVPSAGGGATGETITTFCNTYDSSGTTSSSWVLSLAGFQAWTDVADFSVISYTDEGESYDFVLMPIEGTVSTTNPAFEGTCTMVATPVGGTANSYAQFTVDLPLREKAVMLTTAV